MLSFHKAISFSAPRFKPETAERAVLQFRLLPSCPKLARLGDPFPAVRGRFTFKEVQIQTFYFPVLIEKTFPRGSY